MKNAPLYEDILEGPLDGQARWLITADNVKIRAAYWNFSNSNGTIFVFPGRNEYIEKYGRTCKKIQSIGYSSIVIDWRGQGLSERLVKNKLIGHVNLFQDYQKDVNALVLFATNKRFPKPWFLLAHSMGGAIGLRAINNGLPIQKVIFSAPMWDIKMHQSKLIDKILHFYTKNTYPIYKLFKKENEFVPSTNTVPYLKTEEFEHNTLTNDEEYFCYLKNQILKYPALALAGPSIKWLQTALEECYKLQQTAAPKVPCLTFYSLNDKIVNNTAIEKIMDSWREGRLVNIAHTQHEIFMENDNLLKKIFSDIKCFLEDENM